MSTAEEALFHRVQAPLTRAVAEAVHDTLQRHAAQRATGPALATVLAAALAAVFAGVVGPLRMDRRLDWSEAKLARVWSDVLDLALEAVAKEAAH